MFHETDRYRLFTRSELQERLGSTCTVEWFLREFQITTRCKGRVIAGSDVLRSLADPPSPQEERESAARIPQNAKRSGPGTCATLERLSVKKR